MWLGGAIDRGRWFSFKFKSGQLIEGAVRDDQGRSQGTILVRVLEGVETTEKGHVFRGRYLTASDSHYRWWMTQDGGRRLRNRCLYHSCEGNSQDCGVTKGKSPLVHMEKFRLITSKEWNANVPDWAFKGEPKKEIQEFDLKGGAEKELPKGAISLPWHESGVPSEEAESSSSSSEEEDGGGTVQKIAELKAELKKLEKDAQKKASKESSKKATKTVKKKKKQEPEKAQKKDKDKSRRKKSPSEESEEPKKKGTASKKKKAKASEGKKEEKPSKKRKKKSSSDDDEGESESAEKLFGDAGDAVRKVRKGDRGPFGSGPIVDFRDKPDSDSDKESVFQEAPTQQAKSGQLSLINYSRQKPGRLAARLLMKMRDEVALGSVGAMDEQTSRTPAVAVQYFLTILQPQMASRMNLRTQRELRTIMVALDHLAKSTPARAADVLGQRVKALERASAEGHWASAQFLELIPSDTVSLLDREEEYHIHKEMLLERKVRGTEPGRTKGGGRGDRKGEKGQGRKGVGAEAGKGKAPGRKKANCVDWRLDVPQPWKVWSRGDTPDSEREEEHLRSLLRNASMRGTDIRFHMQAGAEEEQHEVPYPALRWRWRTVTSYRWRQDAHINELEMNALVVMSKHRGRNTAKAGTRWMHVVDSMVSRGALAKGRSSSARINAPLRKHAAASIAQNGLLLPISSQYYKNWARSYTPKRAVMQVEDSGILHMASTLLASVSTRKKGRLLWPYGPHAFREAFQKGLLTLNFPRDSYHPYSLRRGGATWYYQTTLSLDATVTRGRWACVKTARQYIDEGTMQLAHVTWSKDQCRAIARWRRKGVRLRQEVEKRP
eukprot:Skav216655  [mRNA]  locus=scaffold1255:486642:491056:- [translate_table: standard]